MDLFVVLSWFIAFTVIISFFIVVNYFLTRSTSIVDTKGNASDSNRNPTSQRTNSNQNRRKNLRKKQRRQQNSSIDDSNCKLEEKQKLQQEKLSDNDEPSRQESQTSNKTDQEDDEEFQDTISNFKNSSNDSDRIRIVQRVEDEQTPTIPIKTKVKENLKIPNGVKSSDSTTILSKPKASIAPLKQQSSTLAKDSSKKFHETNLDSSSTSSSPKSQPKVSTNSSSIKSRAKDSNTTVQQASKRKIVQASNSILSKPSNINENSLDQTQNHHSANYSGYSSESDLIAESISSGIHQMENRSSINGNENSMKNFDSTRSIAGSNISIDQLLSIFDKNSLSSDELKFLLNKAMTKQSLANDNQQQRFDSTTIKNEKLIERLINENNRNQVKLLSMELQNEKTRVYELIKKNGEMEHSIQHLQSQQPTGIQIQYQQTVTSYQIELKRLSDENNQLMHQLHLYSMMPGTMNELKQQNQLLIDEIQQIDNRNQFLEKEIADGERASKNAAEIYKKADSQKQERIEQMIADLGRYKKIDKDFDSIRREYDEAEKHFQKIFDEIVTERDQLKECCRKTREEFEKLDENQSIPSTARITDESLEIEIEKAKLKHEELRQENFQMAEQLNKLNEEFKSHQINQSS